MPNKYPEKKGWDVPKQKYKLSNWPEYNESLRRRGSIDVWLSPDAISQWYEKDRVYDGTGAPKRYSDFAIYTCHEIRLVYRYDKHKDLSIRYLGRWASILLVLTTLF